MGLELEEVQKVINAVREFGIAHQVIPTEHTEILFRREGLDVDVLLEGDP